MSDRFDIADLVTRILQAVDARDWESARGCFADTVSVDYSSLFGGAPEKLAADVLIERWRGLLPGFDATQHITGPVLVSALAPNNAAARTAVRGYHYVKGAPGGEIWVVAGHYQMRFAKIDGAWRITALTLEAAYQEGNLDLPNLASRRALQA
jgi:hypothetical protein